MCEDQSRYALSLWETSLQCNDVSRWLGACPNWSLHVPCDLDSFGSRHAWGPWSCLPNQLISDHIDDIQWRSFLHYRSRLLTAAEAPTKFHSDQIIHRPIAPSKTLRDRMSRHLVKYSNGMLGTNICLTKKPLHIITEWWREWVRSEQQLHLVNTE